jgi:hypothetical protein
MQDLLQYIDLGFYRSAQLLIAHAEIAQLRRQCSALVGPEQQGKVFTSMARSVADLDHTGDPTATIQSASTERQVTRSGDLDH